MKPATAQLRACAIALAIMAAACAVQLLLWPLIRPSPFLLMSLPIMVASRDETWAPGIVATIAGAIAVNALFMPPYFAFALSGRDLVTTAVFVLVGLAITSVNVSRRRSMRDAAEQSRWLVTTLRSVGDAVIATDREGRVRFLNGVAEELTGWSSAEASGKPLDRVFNIISERTRTPRESPVEKVLRLGNVVRLANHTLLVSRTGEELVIEDSGAPIRDDAGALVGVVLVFRDSTRRSRDALRKELLGEVGAALATSLDYECTLPRVAQACVPRFADSCTIELVGPTGDTRTVARHHCDPDEPATAPDVTPPITVPLRARGRTVGAITFAMAGSGRRFHERDEHFAEELADRIAIAIDNASLYERSLRAIRARDEFLAVASHELKTPLATLQLQLDIWQESMSTALANNARLTRQLEVAHRQARRLANLVDGLLDVSRITSGRLAISAEETDLVQLAGEIVDRFDIQAQRHGCELRLEAASDGVIGVWDRSRIDQVISNLVTNAIKYGAGKPVTIAISQDDASARLVVRDAGIGISQEDVGRIFGRFERAVSTRHYGGLGLGLFIAREIIEAHGGQIQVTSHPGEGSEFTIVLPKEPPPDLVALEERVQ